VKVEETIHHNSAGNRFGSDITKPLEARITISNQDELEIQHKGGNNRDF
jgi:hypothetical protein